MHFPVRREGAFVTRVVAHVKRCSTASTFDIRRGETLGLVGEIRLRQDHRPGVDHPAARLKADGRAKSWFDGQELTSTGLEAAAAMRPLSHAASRSIFQDPYSSLNPRA